MFCLVKIPLVVSAGNIWPLFHFRREESVCDLYYINILSMQSFSYKMFSL